tara:strand:- start:22 stop:339 length:318 start_codon:yes stop_codon:yes gene_type:complete
MGIGFGPGIFCVATTEHLAPGNGLAVHFKTYDGLKLDGCIGHGGPPTYGHLENKNEEGVEIAHHPPELVNSTSVSFEKVCIHQKTYPGLTDRADLTHLNQETLER